MDRLISGGRARKRRRNVTWAIGAAVAVLIGAGVYAVTQLDRKDAASSGTAPTPSGTSTSPAAAAPPTLSEEDGNLEPATYRLLVGIDSAGAPIEADLTVDGPGWDSGNFPVVEAGAIHAGLGVYEPSALAAGSGCSGDAPSADLGQSPRALADQLAGLPASTIVQPVTRTEAYGRDAFHLRLRIADDCPDGQAYRVAETPRGSRGISYSMVPETVVMDFWVLDLAGVPVVVDTWHQSDASADLVDRVSRAAESISFVRP
jgi:hypothetical protein